MGLVITIDGPSASGKSSVSRNLAKKLGFRWVSTGAFYRGLAYVALKEKVNLGDRLSLENLCHSPLWEVHMAPEITEVLWRGQNVTSLLNQEEVGEIASQISQYPEVREALLKPQRRCAQGPWGLIAEGRDCGSVIFPEAPFKFYLTAKSENRAMRRAQEEGRSFDLTYLSQKVRDQRDQSRAAAPLQIPEGAHVIDTSLMTLGQVVEMTFHIVTKSSL